MDGFCIVVEIAYGGFVTVQWWARQVFGYQDQDQDIQSTSLNIKTGINTFIISVLIETGINQWWARLGFSIQIKFFLI